jgi:hypothetical protein
MSNSDLALRQSRLLARRLSQSAKQDSSFIRASFEQVLGRTPMPAELVASQAFLTRQADLFRQNQQEVQSTVAGPDGPSAQPELRARENLVHALFNHTDFVTIR